MMDDRVRTPNSYYLVAKDLYTNFIPSKHLDGYIKEWDYSVHKFIFGQMLRYLFYLIIMDIVNNNITFKMPDSGASIEMAPVTGEDFVRARQHGGFEDVDFLASNFTGYHLQLIFRNRYGSWKKKIYVSPYIKQMITDNTNAGKRYG